MNPGWVEAGSSILGVLFTMVMAFAAYVASRQGIAKSEGALNARIEAMDKRLLEAEGELKDVAKIGTAVAVLSEQVKGFRELVNRDIDELKHTSRNIRAGQDTLSKQISDLMSRPH